MPGPFLLDAPRLLSNDALIKTSEKSNFVRSGGLNCQEALMVQHGLGSVASSELRFAPCVNFAPDRKIILVDGSTLLMAPHWRHRREGELDVLTSPEQTLRMYLLSGEVTTDAEEYARAAWLRVQPAFALKPSRSTQPPATDGWGSVCLITYDVPSDEGRMVAAYVKVFGKRSYIALLESPRYDVEKRQAQLNTILQSWCPREFDVKRLDVTAARAFSAIEFDAFVKASLAELQVPGASIAVIDKGQLVFCEAYGVKEVGKSEPVDRMTNFMVGSITKPLTTLLMGRLVDEKILQWDEPIANKLPQLMLSDSDLMRSVSFRQSVSASTGIPRRGMEHVFRGGRLAPEQMLETLKTTKPTTALGETFQYSNHLVSAGGYAAARARYPEDPLNLAYSKAMEDAVFRPLGMTRSCVAGADPIPLNRAEPHSLALDGKTTPIAQEDSMFSEAPAGGVWSTAHDLARYVLMELNGGLTEDGTRLISTEALLARRAAGVKVDRDKRYGLGLFVEDHRGISMMHHGGGTYGFIADMLFVPDAGFGFVLLANSSEAYTLRQAVRAKLLEIIFADEPNAEKIVDFAKTEQIKMLARFRASVSTAEQDSDWLREWVGRYDNADLGAVELSSMGTDYLLAAESWTTRVGVRMNTGGKKSICVLDPPHIGLTFLLLESEGRRRMVVDGQVMYEFLPI
jgi:CubicO group peptidase (beta-lactamase class C family)